MSTHKKKSEHKKATPAETMRDLADAKQEHARQTPSWPGAREQAQPQHLHAQPSDETALPDAPKTSPSESGYERNDINKRHH